MTSLGTKLDFVQWGRETRRFHGLPMQDYQRVDSHSYGVAMIIRLLIGSESSAERRVRLLEAALDHDLAEFVVGDLPAPTKRRLPDYVTLDNSGPPYVETSFRDVWGKMEDEVMAEAGFQPAELSDTDKRVLKLADAAEGCLHCITERYKGNAHPRLKYCFMEFWSYLGQLGIGSRIMMGDNVAIAQEPGEAALASYIRNEWRTANGGEW